MHLKIDNAAKETNSDVFTDLTLDVLSIQVFWLTLKFLCIIDNEKLPLAYNLNPLNALKNEHWKIYQQKGELLCQFVGLNMEMSHSA